MKILRVFLLFVIVVSILNSFVYASDKSMETGGLIQLGKDWINTGEEESKKGIQFAGNYSKLNELSGLLMGIGIFVVVGSGMVIGGRYMIASPDQKANLKKTLIVYIVGSVLILGALGIWKLVINILESALQ